MKKKKKGNEEESKSISLGSRFIKSLCKMDSMHEISLVTFKDEIAHYFTLDFRIYFLTAWTLRGFFFFFFFCSLVWFEESFLWTKTSDIV